MRRWLPRILALRMMLARARSAVARRWLACVFRPGLASPPKKEAAPLRAWRPRPPGSLALTWRLALVAVTNAADARQLARYIIPHVHPREGRVEEVRAVVMAAMEVVPAGKGVKGGHRRHVACKRALVCEPRGKVAVPKLRRLPLKRFAHEIFPAAAVAVAECVRSTTGYVPNRVCARARGEVLREGLAPEKRGRVWRQGEEVTEPFLHRCLEALLVLLWAVVVHADVDEGDHRVRAVADVQIELDADAEAAAVAVREGGQPAACGIFRVIRAPHCDHLLRGKRRAHPPRLQHSIAPERELVRDRVAEAHDAEIWARYRHLLVRDVV
mmetsp:Transcript_31426/g.73147  ORF Transcript_31426/g.73147 Transcript_31426/m.73147 type:complete len:327 (+) Transcript_31426:201-1181(+)